MALGAGVNYTLNASNQGRAPIDDATLCSTDALRTKRALLVATEVGDLVVFTDGSPSSELGFNYATDVFYSNQTGGGPPFTYVPVPDAEGCDESVTGIRISPSGTMPGINSSGTPSFSIQIGTRVR